MMTVRRKLATALIVLVPVLYLAATAIVPAQVEQRLNRVRSAPAIPVSDRARELHRSLFVADLHADSLLFGRDLLKRGTRGHVDVPRLLEGNVALQAFTVVTKTPRKMNITQNDSSTDDITRLALASGWPPATWTSLAERALYQARRLHDAAAASTGTLTIIRTRADLENFLERRKREPRIVAGFLGIEGAHALDGRLENLDKLYDAGFRMMAPSHFFDTEIGGSAHGTKRGGLTPLGREWVRKMEDKRMLIDLAHASPPTLRDVLALATRPVVVSHTGVRGTCDNQRNLSDEQLRALAANGAVIGIGYWETAVCGTDARAIARAIRYTANLIGVDHVALGSDFDGAVTTPFDTAGLAQITQALLDGGFTEIEIRKIMGANVLELLRRSLP